MQQAVAVREPVAEFAADGAQADEELAADGAEADEPPNKAPGAGRTGLPKMPQLSGEEESGSDVICWPSGSDGHTRSSESGSSGRVVLMKCCASWDSSSDRTAIRRRRNTDGTSEKNEKSSSSVACSSASSKRAENIAQLPEGYSRRGG